MSDDTEVVIIDCEQEAVASAVHSEIAPFVAGQGRVVNRENLDGNVGTWIVVATTAIAALPKILDALARLIQTAKVRSIKIGKTEIRNPTAADIVALGKRVAARHS
jgi:hypothetical protein